MMIPALLLLAVSGTVINEQTGKPAAGTTVTLYKLGNAGPESLESVKAAADGAFSISQTPQGPHLLQAAFEGVTYNHMLFPGRPTEGIRFPVYPASRTPGEAKVTTHMVLVEAPGPELSISESYVWQNEGKTSFYDPKRGTFRFTVPKEASGKIRVMCTHPARSGVPIERAAEKTGEEGVYTVDFAIKPGETRFDLTYTAAGTKITARNLYPATPVNLVAPIGVTLTGEGLSSLGQHPETQASIYRISKAAYEIAVQGTGTLRAPEEENTGADEGQGLKQIRPRLYERFYPILGLVGFILAVGLLLLYRKQPPAQPAAPASATATGREKQKA